MWKEKFRIGVSCIDLQHQELFAKTGELLREVNDSVDKHRDTCISTILFLKGYAVKHFADEEKYQKSIRYVNFDEHKKQHEKFIRTVLDHEQKMLAADFDAKSVKAFTGMLVTWLVYHVTDSDQKVGQYKPEAAQAAWSAQAAQAVLAAQSSQAALSALSSPAGLSSQAARSTQSSPAGLSSHAVRSTQSSPAAQSTQSAQPSQAAMSSTSTQAPGGLPAEFGHNHSDMVYRGVLDTLNTMADIEQDSIKLVDICEETFADSVAIEVALSGEVTGYMTFVYPVPMIKKLIFALMNYVPDNVGELELSALFELSNIVGENICGRISRAEGFTADTRPPVLINMHDETPDERILLDTGIGVIETDIVLEHRLPAVHI